MIDRANHQPRLAGPVRTARVALVWVIIVSVYMGLSLPLFAPGAMTGAEWVSLGILGGYVIAAIYGLVRIATAPRDVAAVLSSAALVALLSAVHFVRLLLDDDWPSGPATMLAAVVALSAVLGIFVALVASWRAHVAVGDHAL
jgi:hypothetical protein